MRQVTRKSLMTVAAATGVIAAAGGYAHADSGAIGSAADSPGIASGNTVQAPVNIPVNVCGNTIDVVGILNPAFGNSCADKGAGHRAPDGQGHRAPGGHRSSGGYGSPGGYGDDQGYGGGSGAGHGGGLGGHHGGRNGGGYGGSGVHTGPGGAHAGGHTGGSPGVGSGNDVQAPVDVPLNVCGNSVDIVGILNPSFGNDCDNTGGYDHVTPPGRGHETPGTPGHQGPGKPSHQGPGKPAHPGQSNPSGPDHVPSGPGHVTPAGSVNTHQSALGTPVGPGRLAETGNELPIGLALPAGAGALLAGALIYRKARASV
ncbi:chaplin [Streptomyces sp. NPDC002588]|uniref:chaplin n=1 Tax=Streptomyces sp. NPDC002588 TaxID=3154419 RepID=UPI00332BA8FB